MEVQVHRSSNGQYFVRAVAANGRILAHSETYTTKANATNCANLIAAGGTVEDHAK